MTAAVELLSFIPTSATTKRGLADWASDNFLNVKNFNAIGDGSTDDTTAIQACFNAAFGTSGSPHGTTATSNRPVYFPPGHYRAHDLLLTQVKGGLIYGAGQGVTIIQHIGSVSSTSTIIKTNGCDGTTFKGFTLRGNGPTSTIVGIDLDWGGSGSVGLKNNSLTGIILENLHTGIRVGETGNEGYGNYFFQVFGGNGTYGIKVKSTGAGSNTFIICGLNDMNAGGGGTISSPTGPYGYGMWFVSGTATVIDPGLAGLQTDFKWDSDEILTLCGCRSESLNFLEATDGKVLIMSSQYDLGPSLSSSWKRFVNMTSPATVIMDNCMGAYNASIVGTGTLYLRGGTEFRSDAFTARTDYMSGFTGTVREHMVRDAIPWADRPTAAEGCEIIVTNADIAGKVWGDNVTASSGTTHSLLRWNGSNWTLMGK